MRQPDRSGRDASKDRPKDVSVLRCRCVRQMLGQSRRCVPRLRRLDGEHLRGVCRIRNGRRRRTDNGARVRCHCRYGHRGRGRPGPGSARSRPALPDRLRCPCRRSRRGLGARAQYQEPVPCRGRGSRRYGDAGRTRGNGYCCHSICTAIARGRRGRSAHRIACVPVFGRDRGGGQPEWDSRRAGWNSLVGTGRDSQSDATSDGCADTSLDARANTPPDAGPDALCTGRAPAHRRAQSERCDDLERGRVQWHRHDTAWSWELRDRLTGPGSWPDIPLRFLRDGRALSRAVAPLAASSPNPGERGPRLIR